MEFTLDKITERYHELIEHSIRAIKKKLHVAYLKLNLSHKDIALIARVNTDTVTRYLQEYNKSSFPPTRQKWIQNGKKYFLENELKPLLN